MSAKSLAQLAAARDTNPPGQSVVKDSTDVLVAAVPTEALAAYTAVIGVVLAANIGTSYGAFRWSAYGTFIALAMLAPILLVKRNTTDKVIRKLPVPECLTAGVAAAAWGLVMPGNPLTMIIKGNALVFTTTAILVGTAAVITLTAQRLGTANSRVPMPTDGTAPAARRDVPPAASRDVPPAAADGSSPAENTAAPASANGATPAPANSATATENAADPPTANGTDPAEKAADPHRAG